MKASKEVSGMEANIPAKKEERLAISATTTIVIAVITVLIIK